MRRIELVELVGQVGLILIESASKQVKLLCVVHAVFRIHESNEYARFQYTCFLK